jgi:hypothetical protein
MYHAPERQQRRHEGVIHQAPTTSRKTQRIFNDSNSSQGFYFNRSTAWQADLSLQEV